MRYRGNRGVFTLSIRLISIEANDFYGFSIVPSIVQLDSIRLSTLSVLSLFRRRNSTQLPTTLWPLSMSYTIFLSYLLLVWITSTCLTAILSNLCLHG